MTAGYHGRHGFAAMNLTSRNIRFTMLARHDRLQTLRLDRLHREWQQAASDSALPGASFFDPQKLGYLLDATILFDVERPSEAQTRFRYRRIGSQIIERRGRDRTGEYLDQHPEPGFAEAARRVCELVLEARAPVHGVMQREIDGRNYGMEVLVLPLGDGSGEVTHLLAAELYPADAPRQTGEPQRRSG